MNLRVASYNIRHGQGLDGEVDLERTRAVIEGMNADIIGLQEVDRRNARSGNIDQVRFLARALNMYHVFGPALMRGEAHFGNAVLSRHPIQYSENFLMESSRETRSVMRTAIQVAGRRISFINSHLGLSQKERLRHIRQFILPLLSGRRVLLAGDFNCLPHAHELSILKTILEDSCPEKGCETFPASQPGERIDFILHSPGLTAVSCQAVPAAASDHYPLLMELLFR